MRISIMFSFILVFLSLNYIQPILIDRIKLTIIIKNRLDKLII